MKSEKSIQRHFSRAASVYAEGSSFHLELNRKLLNASLRLSSTSDVLELGCGAGQLAAEFSRCFPESNITALDISPEMIKVAEDKHSQCSSISWTRGEATSLLQAMPGKSLDVVLSSSSIQWMRPYPELFKAIFASLRSEGILLFDCISKGTLETLKSCRRELFADLDSLPLELPSMLELAHLLTDSGFEVFYSEKESFFESYPSFNELLSSLKTRGFTAKLFSQGSRSLTRGELSLLAEKYPVQMDGSYKAEFVSTIFFARKP